MAKNGNHRNAGNGKKRQTKKKSTMGAVPGNRNMRKLLDRLERDEMASRRRPRR